MPGDEVFSMGSRPARLGGAVALCHDVSHRGLLLRHTLGTILLRQLPQAVSARGLPQGYERAEEDCDTCQDLRGAQGTVSHGRSPEIVLLTS